MQGGAGRVAGASILQAGGFWHAVPGSPAGPAYYRAACLVRCPCTGRRLASRPSTQAPPRRMGLISASDGACRAVCALPPPERVRHLVRDTAAWFRIATAGIRGAGLPHEIYIHLGQQRWCSSSASGASLRASGVQCCAPRWPPQPPRWLPATASRCCRRRQVGAVGDSKSVL